MIVHIQTDQLLTQLLIEQLDSLPSQYRHMDIYMKKFDAEFCFDKWQLRELRHFPCMFNRGYDCAMIGHTQLFLWSRYSDIISLLTITERGNQISIAYCLFSG